MMLLAVLPLLTFSVSTFSQTNPPDSSEGINETVKELSLKNSSCTTWRVKRGGFCTCGVVYAGSVIQCYGSHQPIRVLHGYCVTHPASDNSTLIVGSCQYNFMAYHQSSNPYYSAKLPEDPQQVEQAMCEDYNRTGQLCGDCEPGHSPPVFTYHPQCIPCPVGTNNWGRYLAYSLLPQTAFFLAVLVLRLRVTSPALEGFILYSQLITPPPVLRTAATVLFNFRQDPYHSDQTFEHLTETTFTFHSIWNLDFFRLIYNPFCLTPNTSTLQILALDYIIAVGPLLAIALTYILVKLHYYNCILIVCIWRDPLKKFSAWLNRSWNPHTSLIDAFATFLLLSYIKILSVSFTLLFPAIIFEMEVERSYPKQYLYYASTTEYLGSQHILYALLACTNLTIFTILPILLLCLYPCRCFQHFLNSRGLSCQALHTFMDAFQGPYKNGTAESMEVEERKGRDYRYFAGGKLILMAAVFMSLVCQILFLNFWATFWVVLIYMTIFSTCRPFRQEKQNNWHILWLALTLLFYGSTIPFGLEHTENQNLVGGLSFLVSFSVVPITIVYIIWRVIVQCLKCTKCLLVAKAAMDRRNNRPLSGVIRDHSSSSSEEEDATTPLLTAN